MNSSDSLIIFKALGMICLVIVTFISFLPIKHSQIEKFGGGAEQTPEVNKDISELKRKTIFKLIVNFFIVIIITITLIANILVPDTITNQVALIIFVAGVTSLGIKISYDLTK